MRRFIGLKRVSPRVLFMGIIISLIVVVAIAFGVSAAVGYSQTISNHVVGTAPDPTYNFELYESDGVTQLANPIDWGNLKVGETKTHTVVVKNKGNQTFGIEVNSSTLPNGWTLTSVCPTSITPDHVGQVVLTLTTTSTGTVDFATTFNAVY